MVVKWKAKLYAKEGMSKEEFVDYWLKKHAPLAKQIPGIRKYVISIVVTADGEEPGYQGTAELWFDSMADVQKAISTPAGKKAMADVANFARKATTVTVEEHSII